MRIAFFLVSSLMVSLVGYSQEVNQTRFVGVGELADVVIEIDGIAARLYLSNHKTNEPIQKAQLTLQQDKEEGILFKETGEPGIYEVTLKSPKDLPGQLLLQTDSDSDAIDVKAADYSVLPLVQASAKQSGTFSLKSFGLGALAVVVAMAIFLLTLRSSRFRKFLPSLFFVFLLPYPTHFMRVAYAHGGHDHGGGDDNSQPQVNGTEVILAKKSQFLIGLRTVEVASEKTSPILKTFGHVVPKPQNDGMIVAPQGGFLKGTQGLVLGKRVKQGDTLGYIQTVAQIRLSSPIDGEIAEIHAVDGMRIEGGSKIVRITNSDVLWVDAELFASQIARLPEATSAYTLIDGNTGNIEAKIIGAMTPISEETRTAKVFLELINPPKNLKIGTFVSAIFSLGKNSEQDSLLIPKSSLLSRAGEQIVFVQTGPEKFSLRQLIAEDSSKAGFVVVTKGLKQGERVVTEGNYQLMMKVK